MADIKKIRKSASKTERGLSPEQEEFCLFYTSHKRELFGNGVRCYLEAYGKGKSKPMSFMVAAALASRLLTTVKIIARINELLETGGFSNENVDKQHLFLINQHADLKTKLGAIKEYNELKERVKKKVELGATKELIEALASLNKILDD